MTIESLTSIFRLANVDDRLGTVFVLSEQKINAWVIKFPSQLAYRQLAARDEDC
jgi:hypothetical protein